MAYAMMARVIGACLCRDARIHDLVLEVADELIVIAVGSC
jgi:hypothetical protein